MKKLFFWFLLFPFWALGQDSLYKHSVEELMKISRQEDYNAVSISLATKSSKALETSPAVISVFTQKDIENWACRDMSDVLRLVQGFEFGVDVQALYGLGFRGIWAHEGKALVMINGLTINCFGFGNGNYFGTLPANMIERVEIIRGPGSALYGGFAEVAVINIITKHEENSIQTFGGLIGKELTYGANVSFNLKKDESTYLSMQIGSQISPMSNRIYEDFLGNKLQMGHSSSWRKWQHILLRGKHKNFELVYNRTFTNFLAQTLFGMVLPKNKQGIYTNELNNFTENLQLKYNWFIGKKILVQPTLEFSQGNPISSAVNASFYVDSLQKVKFYNPADMWQNQKVLGQKYIAEINTYYKTDQEEWILGGGYQLNTLNSLTADGSAGLQTSPLPADTTQYMRTNNAYIFLQYIRQVQNFNLIVGGRYEITPFGNAIAPRLGITWSKNSFHAKILYGRAFRVPQLWQAFSRQFFIRESLSPETTNTIEIELGYKISENLKVLLNGFWINIDKPLTYIGLNNSYQNYGNIASMGLEGEINWRKAFQGAFLNFSYVVPSQNTSIDFVSKNKEAFLALPTLKINTGYYYQYKRLTLSATLTYLGKRHGQSSISAQQSSVDETLFESKTYDALLLLNLAIQYKGLWKKIDVSSQIHNLLDSPYAVIQPYYGGHAPLPVNDRQFSLSLKYNF